MRVFKFVGDTEHDDSNNPMGMNFHGVYFALDKPTDVSDEIGAFLENHSHFKEVGAKGLGSGSGAGSGNKKKKSAKKTAKKVGKKRVSKKKRSRKKT